MKTLAKLPLVAALATMTTLVFMLPAAHAQDAQAGEKKAAMCIGCHGIPAYQASFPEVYKVPMISGQPDKYIAAALTAYRKGDRKHPTMRGIAGSLSDKDIADLAAFYATHGIDKGAKAPDEVPPPQGVAAQLLTKGACAACHGANYSKPVDPSYPKLAGQHADYLYMALREYAVANNPLVGRNHAIMGAQVKAFSHAELKAMADYLSSLPGELHVVQQSRFRVD